jgi:hypothetical protein
MSCLCSQYQQEREARQREEETFRAIGTQVATVPRKSQLRSVRGEDAPKQRKPQAADAGEIMAQLTTQRNNQNRAKRTRAPDDVPPGNTIQSMLTASAPQVASTPQTTSEQPQPMDVQIPASAVAPRSSRMNAGARRRKGATFVVD